MVQIGGPTDGADQLILELYLAGVGLLYVGVAEGAPPMAFVVAATSLALGAANFGEPMEIFQAAEQWRDKLGGFADRGQGLLDTFDKTNAGTWEGVARDEFLAYLNRLKDIGVAFDGAVSMMYNELQWFALALVVGDLALVTYTVAMAAIIWALVPGLIPFMETAPAIASFSLAYVEALAIFAFDTAELATAGAFLQGNIRSAFDGLTHKLWAEGQHDPQDAMKGNRAVVEIPPVSQWEHNHRLDAPG